MVLGEYCKVYTTWTGVFSHTEAMKGVVLVPSSDGVDVLLQLPEDLGAQNDQLWIVLVSTCHSRQV